MTEGEVLPQTPRLSGTAFKAAAGLSVLLLSGLVFVMPVTAALASAYLAFTMGLITISDLRYFTIPDVLSLPAIPAGIMVNALLWSGGGGASALQDSVLGACAGAGVFYLLRILYHRLRGIEGLGLGDVKLAGVAGAWLGLDLLAPTCLLASLGALMAVMLQAAFTRDRRGLRNAHVPFGSFIAPSIFIFWVVRLSGIVV